MLYRQKKNTFIKNHNGRGYIINSDTLADRTVDESGTVFLFAITRKPQTIEQLVDKLLEVFVGVERSIILPDACAFYDRLVTEGFLVKGENESELDACDTNFIYDYENRKTNERSQINFYIPGFDLKFLNFYRSMISYMSEFSYRFMENIKIPAFYGSFNNMIWNGGRLRLGRQPSFDEMRKAIEDVNNMGVAVRYTYTNCTLDDKNLNDTFCNLSMELANNGKNEVLVNSPVLETYLRKNFPNFKYILSTTACERDVNKINEATKKYDLVVIDWRDNKNMNFLEKLEDKNKIEILINEKCPSACKIRKMHYELASKKICYKMPASECPAFDCLRSKADTKGFYRCLKNSLDTNLTHSELYGKYYDMGFRHFKIVGRNEDDYLSELESYIYYMASPECRDIVRYDLLGIYMDYVIDSFGGNRNKALQWYAEKLDKNKNHN